jgi:hypothetical protein
MPLDDSASPAEPPVWRDRIAMHPAVAAWSAPRQRRPPNGGLPRRQTGRPTPAGEWQYREDVGAFCRRILKVNSTLDFRVGSRGWGYLLENEGVITKGDMDAAQRLINDCRKSGDLPLDICADDDKRAAEGLEDLDDEDVDEWADILIAQFHKAHNYYTPLSFWEDLDTYVEIAVEKGDLKRLFEPVCRDFGIAITNVGGWADLNSRAAMMRRFRDHERAGRRPVLLYCGDHDPGGLHISGFLRSNLEDLAGAVGWRPDNLIIDRFGLNADFIEANGLLWIDNLETSGGGRLDDPRHRDHRKPYVQDYLREFGARKVEANALVVRPREGRELCRQAILKYVPASAPAAYQAKLAIIRAELRDAIRERLGEPP